MLIQTIYCGRSIFDPCRAQRNKQAIIGKGYQNAKTKMTVPWNQVNFFEHQEASSTYFHCSIEKLNWALLLVLHII